MDVLFHPQLTFFLRLPKFTCLFCCIIALRQGIKVTRIYARQNYVKLKRNA